MNTDSPDFSAARRRGPRPAASNPDRLPPHSIEAEQGVLGCILMAPLDTLATAAEKLGGAEAFYDTRHQMLFEVLLSMSSEARPIDLISLTQRLRDDPSGNQLDAIGGAAYLGELEASVPSAANIGYYAAIVVEKAMLRRILRSATNVLGRVHEWEGGVADLLSSFMAEVLGLAETSTRSVERPIQDFLKEAIDLVDKHVQGRKGMLGLSTGINFLDSMTSGLQPHQYWLLAGRPGGGKTSLAMQIGAHVAVALRQPVAVFSLEMDGLTLALRELFGRAGVSFQAFRNGFLPEDSQKRLFMAAHAFGADKDRGLAPAPLWIDATPNLTCDDFALRVRRMHRKYGIKVFVVDYLQLFQGKAGKDYGSENLVMLLNDVSAAIVRLKKELPVTFLMAGQENTNRERSEKDRKPLLSDFKDSQKPPADADLVAFLADVDMSRALRDQGSKDEGKREVAAAMLSWLEAPPVQALPAELRGTDRNQDTWWGHHLKRVNLYVAKQRNGPTGDCQLVMVRPWMRFLDVRVTAEEAGKRASQRDLTITDADANWGNEEPAP